MWFLFANLQWLESNQSWSYATLLLKSIILAPSTPEDNSIQWSNPRKTNIKEYAQEPCDYRLSLNFNLGKKDGWFEIYKRDWNSIKKVAELEVIAYCSAGRIG